MAIKETRLTIKPLVPAENSVALRSIKESILSGTPKKSALPAPNLYIYFILMALTVLLGAFNTPVTNH